MRPPRAGHVSDAATVLSGHLVMAARRSLQTDVYYFPLEPEKGAAEVPYCEATMGDSSSRGPEAPPCRAIPPELAPALSAPEAAAQRSPPESVSQGAVTMPTGCAPSSTSRCSMWGAWKAPGRQGSQIPGCAPQKGNGPLIA